MLSEFSSSSLDDKSKEDGKRWGMKMFSDNKDHEQFIETVVEKNNTINRKLLNIQVLKFFIMNIVDRKMFEILSH